MGLPGIKVTIAELADLGVKRISLGSTLARAAIGAFLAAAREVKEHGSFGYAAAAASTREITAMLEGPPQRK
jgi:2-methylisocitrate lyase-like PEP mutase family enzyme